MTTQKQQLADSGQYHPTDVPRPFVNQINSSTRIPETLVNSGNETFDWKLNGGVSDIKVSGGFNERDDAHSPKSNVLYLDDKNTDPKNPGKISGRINIGLDYVVSGNKMVAPWYSGTVESISRVKAGDTHSYGNQVVIKTNQSYQDAKGNKYPIYNAYSHLESIQPGIVRGVEVNTGDYIGKMGQSGLTVDKKRDKKHVDFQSYILVDGKKVQISPNLMQSNLEKQQAARFQTGQNNTSGSNTVASNTTTQSYARVNEETTTDASSGIKSISSESQNLTSKETKSNADVSKAIAAIKENADGIKQQYGLDVTTSEGLGKAVMIYWKENNLDPKTLKEQLPNMKGSDIDAALASVTETKTVETTKTKQVEAQRQ
jgi:hypothetical protein